jgi:hypothetical protein
MPQKVEGVRHDKVVSTKLSQAQYESLKTWAKELYLQNVLAQPNTSQMLEFIVRRALRARDRILTQKKSSVGPTVQPPETL